MKSSSEATIRALQMLRKSAVATASLCDNMIFDSASNRNNALRLLPSALLILQARVQTAIDALAQEGPP